MAVSKAQLKAKMRVTKASKARAKAGTARAKPEYVKLRVGYGKQFDPADIAKRKKQFARQQGENKGKVRSLVARGTQRGRQERMRGVEFKRGVKVATTRLSILKGWGEMEVIAERSVTSSWVRMIHLVKFHGQPALAITFHSGFVALYPTTNIRDYEAMAAAASKGRYIWTALYHGRPGQGAPYISIGF